MGFLLRQFSFILPPEGDTFRLIPLAVVFSTAGKQEAPNTLNVLGFFYITYLVDKGKI